MSCINEGTYGGLWDLGNFLGTDMITSPIRRIINRDAERAGIDLTNPRRSAVRLSAILVHDAANRATVFLENIMICHGDAALKNAHIPSRIFGGLRARPKRGEISHMNE